MATNEDLRPKTTAADSKEDRRRSSVLPEVARAQGALHDSTILALTRELSLRTPVHSNSSEVSPKMDPASILHNPHFNKGTAFTIAERNRMGLRGLLPNVVESIDTQVRRCIMQLQRFSDAMSKHVYLSSLRDRNDTLFYRLVIQNLEECLPYLYTPTVGQACLEFGLQYRQAEGMYFCQDDKGKMRSMLENWRPNRESQVAIIVLTDGSRILGLGDLGACGMGIPLGKLSLYVAAGGFHPACVLPVVLDSGTNNEKLLKDEFYLGKKHKRLTDAKYYPLVDELLMAFKEKWPRAVVQFEDFSNDHCFKLLADYRKRILCFNDDIQGTGVVVAAGFLNALRIAGFASRDQVAELRLIFAGAGSAAIGVADQIRWALIKRYGFSEDDTRKMVYLTDSKGLVTSTRGDSETLANFKRAYARVDIEGAVTDLLQLMDMVKPHALIGLSGHSGHFSKEVIQKISELNERPVIFALSNPTSKSECTFQDAVTYTDGRVVFAAGSPFANVVYNGKLHIASQGNNLYAFPGIGFGAWLANVSTITDGMMDAATLALADTATEDDLAEGRLYPRLQLVREVSAQIATAVILEAHKEALTDNDELPYDDRQEMVEHVTSCMYSPHYLDWPAQQHASCLSGCSSGC